MYTYVLDNLTLWYVLWHVGINDCPKQLKKVQHLVWMHVDDHDSWSFHNKMFTWEFSFITATQFTTDINTLFFILSVCT